MKLTIAFLLFLTYLFVERASIRKINSYVGFSKKQKTIHTVLSLLLPVLWPVLISVLIKPEPGPNELYELRQKERPYDNGHNEPNGA